MDSQRQENHVPGSASRQTSDCADSHEIWKGKGGTICEREAGLDSSGPAGYGAKGKRAGEEKRESATMDQKRLRTA